ncbi:japanin-like-RS isoform X2 [Dermacentor variabilis]|uniref:japanin-like-RS isoform X2 n=1 Tax=Dermacentor variabilis TaxID=34621 RepID=UPI003F5C2C58
MCIRLLATFALYAFVFASCCLAGNNSVAHEHHRYVLPANSTDTLYLIGYSLDLFNWNLTCVRTSFIRREGEVVYRNLTFNYTEEFNKTLPEEMTFQLQVKVPDTPIMFNLEVNATDRGLLNYTEVQPTYRIIYYNNDSMVLGNMMPTVSEDTGRLWPVKGKRRLEGPGLAVTAEVTKWQKQE